MERLSAASWLGLSVGLQLVCTIINYLYHPRVANCLLGPCIGGIIVTFAQWRIIYWLQFAMTLLGLILSLLFVPSIQEKNRSSSKPKFCTVISMFNPLHIFRQFIYPNVFLAVSIICQLKYWNCILSSGWLTSNSASHVAFFLHSNTQFSHQPAQFSIHVSTWRLLSSAAYSTSPQE